MRIWSRVYGVKKPYYKFNGEKVFIKNKSNIRDFKKGREIRIGSLISKKYKIKDDR